MPKRSVLAKIRARLPRLGKKPEKYLIGFDTMADFKEKLPSYEMQVIFDVGANKGQSAMKFRKHWPKAQIHSFEPFQYAFQKLLDNTKGFNVTCHNFALGASNGHLDVQISDINKNSVRNSLLPENNIHDPEQLKTENIQLMTLSDFCREHAITFIDFLKIDTEGYDLEVLKGAVSLLNSTSILCIQTEVGMNPMNNFHVDFQSVRDFLASYGYLLFGFYDQAQEWKPTRPILRRCDAVFISDKLTTVEQLKSYRDL